MQGATIRRTQKNNLRSLGCQLCNFLKTYGKNVLFFDFSFLKPYLQSKVPEKPTNSTFFRP